MVAQTLHPGVAPALGRGRAGQIPGPVEHDLRAMIGREILDRLFADAQRLFDVTPNEPEHRPIEMDQ